MVRRTKSGYWFDTKSYELIEAYDHYQFLSELEGKVRSELDPGKSGRAWAKSLGMAVGEGWGRVPKESPFEAKRRFMFNAFKAGWVRIRRHSDMPVMVMEFWRRSDDMLASLALALKKMGVPETERVELHEVEKDQPSMAYAGDLYKLIDPAAEMSREEEGRLGFSIYTNPARRRARLVPSGGKARKPSKYIDLGGAWFHKATGYWTPSENPRIYGPLCKANPVTLEKFIDPPTGAGEGESIARIFLGLKRGVGEGKGQDIDLDKVVQFVKQMRAKQFKGLPGGASFILQRGYFTDYDENRLHEDEDSVQILMFPDGDEFEEKVIGGKTWYLVRKKQKSDEVYESVFEDRMKEVALALAPHFGQKSVILNLVVDGEVKFLGQAKQT